MAQVMATCITMHRLGQQKHPTHDVRWVQQTMNLLLLAILHQVIDLSVLWVLDQVRHYSLNLTNEAAS